MCRPDCAAGLESKVRKRNRRLSAPVRGENRSVPLNDLLRLLLLGSGLLLRRRGLFLGLGSLHLRVLLGFGGLGGLLAALLGFGLRLLLFLRRSGGDRLLCLL